MRKEGLSVSALGATAVVALLVTGMLVTAGPAQADGTWFAPAVRSDIDNGAGPGPAPRGSAIADFDGDGHADLVSIGQFTLGEVLVSPGNGDGTFGGGVAISGTSGTQGLDAGDVDGDGDADVVVMSTYDLTVLRNDGSGHFSAGGTYPLLLGGQVQPRLVDLEGDGDLDVVAPTFTSIQTLRNDSSGAFTPGPSSWVMGASVLSAITPAHLDADGNADLFAVDGTTGTAFALRGDGTGKFTVSSRMYGTSFIPEDVAAIDLDDDGYDDIAVVGSFSFSLATGLTNGSGKFTSLLAANYQYGGLGPTSASVADFDGDGRDDLVVSALANPLQGTLTVLAGNGTEKPSAAGTYATAPLPQNPVLADYDGDGATDIATVSPGAISFLSNNTAP